MDRVLNGHLLYSSEDDICSGSPLPSTPNIQIINKVTAE